jgi:hypothetical protein
MIERQTELNRRHHRKAKMRKLKTKLAKATGADRDTILGKIKRLSPQWTEASLNQKATSVATPKAERKASAPKVDKKPTGPRKPAAPKA